MKHVLIWVPVIGLAWWALDMPFLKRYTKEEIQENPELRGKDIKAMEKSLKGIVDILFQFLVLLKEQDLLKRRRIISYLSLNICLIQKLGG